MRQSAIFDLDGTLIPNTSAERTFFFHLLRSGGLSVIDILRMVPVLWSAKGNLHTMILKNKRYLRHKSVETFEKVAREYFEPRIQSIVYKEMLSVIEKHRTAGDLLLLLTGTLDFIAACFVRELRFDGARATNLEIHNGKYTGHINGITPYGVGKLEVLRDFRRRHNFDLNHTTLYANIYSDRYVMNAVDIPVAVNPDERLRFYAQRNQWRILDCKKAKKIA